jgi:UDP-2-acetamido-3-amino-2,3-dideoxy-glucuronate N-acetyltransferase
MADSAEHTTPRVTVHVPCYNYARFLPEALDSLLAQSFADWEAVVIDDASDDDTAAVLSRYRDPRIRIVRHPVNRGHIATYNEGISLAAGEFFVILSADDRYKPCFLARVLQCFEEHPEVALVYTDGDLIDENGDLLRRNDGTFGTSGVYEGLPVLFERTFVAASGGVARTATLRKVGGYDPDFPHTADAYLWCRLAILGPLGYVAESLYDFRLHEGSMQHQLPRSQVLETEHVEQLRRIFAAPDLPAAVRALEPDAYGALHWRIARAHLTERNFGRSVWHVGLAVAHDPGILRRHHPVRALVQVVMRSPNRARSASRREASVPVSVHDTARCDATDVGAGTKIWAFAHVMAGARIGTECKIGDHVFIETGAVIGDRVTIKNGTLVWDGVVIDHDVFVGPGVVFTNDLVPRAHVIKGREQFLATCVRQGASIGANATVVCGTTIGRHAMVGAGSVVTRDVGDYALVVGNPAVRSGWVCECGLRLAPDLRCECGRSYRPIDRADALEPLEP